MWHTRETCPCMNHAWFCKPYTYKFKLARVIISLFTLYCTCILDNAFLCVNAFSHFVIYNPHVQGTTYVDQGYNDSRVAHEKSDSRAACEVLLACSTWSLTRVQHTNITRVQCTKYCTCTDCCVSLVFHMRITRQKLKNTRVFSARECPLRNELYCSWRNATKICKVRKWP